MLLDGLTHISDSRLFSGIRARKSEILSSAIASASTVCLTAGTLLLAASAFSVYRINQLEDISVNPGVLSWISDSNFALQKGEEALGPTVSENNWADLSFVGPSAPAYHVAAQNPKARTAPQVATVWTAHPKAHHPIVARTAHTAQPAAPAVQTSKRAVTLTAQSTPTPELASESELTTLRLMYGSLRGTFIAAMTTQNSEVAAKSTEPSESENDEVTHQAVQPQELAAVEVQPEPPTFHSLVKRGSGKSPQSAPQGIASIQTTQTQETKAPSKPVTEEAKSDEAQPEKSDTILSSAAAPSELTDLAPQNEPEYSNVEPARDAAQAVQEGQALSDAPAAQPAKAESSSAVIVSVPGGATRKIEIAQTTVQNGIPKPTSPTKAFPPATVQPAKPTPGTKSTDSQNLLAAAAQAMNTQSTLLAAKAQVPAPSKTGYSVSRVQSVMDSQRRLSLYVEAFDWVTPVSGGMTEYFAKEKAGSGWVISHVQDHWPTLSRQSQASVALISTNTAKLLSALTGAALQTEAGIVFGKLPPGYSVRLSGRAERPVFLNEKNQSVTASRLDGERFFAFLNVSPGAHLLYVTDQAGVEEGAVGLAVLGGTASFADLRDLRKVRIAGKVLDGGDAQVRPVSAATVRVLGSVTAHTETDRKGKFSIDHVLAAGDFPIYVETDAAGGMTHRYQIKADDGEALVLYRLNDTAIQTWTSQLEGAVSPEGGIVVAATPGLLNTGSAPAKLLPSVRSFAEMPTLRPEVYTLSPSGQMQVGESLDPQSARFVSVQVPEGPAVTSLTDPNGNLVWSELVMASPAVVNVLGPY